MDKLGYSLILKFNKCIVVYISGVKLILVNGLHTDNFDLNAYQGKPLCDIL